VPLKENVWYYNCQQEHDLYSEGYVYKYIKTAPVRKRHSQ